MGAKTVFVQPDAFRGLLEDKAGYIPTYDSKGGPTPKREIAARDQDGGTFDFSSASRPVNGIVVRPNTQAFVQVMRADCTILKVFNQLTKPLNTNGKDDHREGYGHGTPSSGAWTDWLLQSVHEERVEKTQVVETFGETYLYAFGEKPRALAFTGLLMNTVDFNWRAIFWENWDRYFRATKLIEANARLYIGFDDIIVEGYPVNAVASQTADMPNAMSFSFNLFVTNYTNISAQRGFLTRGVNDLEVVRAGFTRGEATLKSSRMTVLQLLGKSLGLSAPPDALPSAVLASEMYKKLKNQGLSDEEAALAARTVGGAANLAETLPFVRLTGEVNALSFLKAFTTSTALDVFRTGSNIGIKALEDKANLKHGQVNAWFGNLAAMLDAQLPPITPEILATDAGLLLDAARNGSVDGIVRAMAYNVSSGLNAGAKKKRPDAMVAIQS